MATYVLVHGAGSDSGYWYRVVPELQARGHEVITPDLPCDDDTAGLSEYAETIVRAVGQRPGVILVAQSLAGLVAPLACEKLAVDLLVLVAAMVPAPGETGGDWWANTGQPRAQRELAIQQGRDPDAAFDPVELFLHDLPPQILREALSHPPRPQSSSVFAEPWPLPAWPRVPTRFLLAKRDRLFPAEFLRRVVSERLGITPDEIDSGHLPALGQPVELVRWLERYRADLTLNR